MRLFRALESERALHIFPQKKAFLRQKAQKIRKIPVFEVQNALLLNPLTFPFSNVSHGWDGS